MNTQATERRSWFELNAVKTIGFSVALLIGVIFLLVELSLRYLGGYGNPVLYDSSPVYGYRLMPNQEVTRFHGARIRVNNLGLRADEDWNDEIENKILFVGNSVTYGGSYVSNDELLSHLAVKDISGFKSGSAGVNGWGIENMHGLVVESQFLPAKVYVSVLIEDDFYRGLTRLQGQPYWCVKPSCAFQELLYTFYYYEMNKRYRRWTEYASSDSKAKVVEKATIALKKIDDFLSTHGRIHLIYISPTRLQVLNRQNVDSLVAKYLNENGLHANYLLDRIRQSKLGLQEKEALFHGEVHLEKSGHALWGGIIGADLIDLLAPYFQPSATH